MRIEDLTLEPCVKPRERVRDKLGEQITDEPDRVYQADLKYIWVEETGWTYLHTIIDCCTSQWLAYVYKVLLGVSQLAGLSGGSLTLDTRPRRPGARSGESTTRRADVPTPRADPWENRRSRPPGTAEAIGEPVEGDTPPTAWPPRHASLTLARSRPLLTHPERHLCTIGTAEFGRRSDCWTTR